MPKQLLFEACPSCGRVGLEGVEYWHTSKNHYDGISEWECPQCKTRIGRWSRVILQLGEEEGRYGVCSPVKVGEPTGLAWKCDSCGEERSDVNINVMSYDLEGMTYGVRNLKYCNDRPECLEKAEQKALTKRL